MSQEMDTAEQVKNKIVNELMPAIQASESATVDLAGESIDIPQQTKARLKQKKTAIRVQCVTLLNQIQ